MPDVALAAHVSADTKGSKHTSTVAPQQNGVSEQDGQTLAALSRCMLKDSNDTPQKATAPEMGHLCAQIRGILHDSTHNLEKEDRSSPAAGASSPAAGASSPGAGKPSSGTETSLSGTGIPPSEDGVSWFGITPAVLPGIKPRIAPSSAGVAPDAPTHATANTKPNSSMENILAARQLRENRG